jgi:8-oxo-dGTP pyrophosphatase MutT (NUDIX family)
MSDVPRPGPGEELNLDGPPVEPRQAATVIVLRGGADALELLLVQRNPEQRFMGGAWVFPGGAVDAGEGDGDEAHRLAAVREVEEEAGVQLPDPAALVKFSRWITPAMVKIRFDTHFFLADMPPGQQVRIDGSECVDFRWTTPQDALEAHRNGQLLLVFPTIKHLEQLAPFPSSDALLAHTRGREVRAVEPKVLGAGEEARVVLPGEPGYEDG